MKSTLTAADVVEEFANFLKTRAGMYRHSNTPGMPNPPIPDHDWLMEEIEVLQDVEHWSIDDVARMSALFFFLLTQPPKT